MSVRFTGESEKIPHISTVGMRELDANPKTEMLRALKSGHAVLEATEFNFTSPFDKPSAKGAFIVKEELRGDREDSKHQVEFGQFVLNAKGHYEQPFLGAVKPIESPEYLVAEMDAGYYLNTLSDRQLAYLPLGAWRDVEGILQFITLYEHDVTTFDRVFWADRNLNPEALRPDTIENGLHSCIRGLGYLHGVGVTHGDAEVKNLAQDRQGVRFVDLEDMRMLPRVDGKIQVTGKSIEYIRTDIEAFIDSTLMVEENRPLTRPLLQKRGVAKKLAQSYRAGLDDAQNDTGIVAPRSFVQTEAYFNDSIEHALRTAVL